MSDMPSVHDVLERHVELFNAGVRQHDFGAMLSQFADDAVMRFENVPGVGVIEFAGRQAFTAGYEEQPPDDRICIAAPVRNEGQTLVIPFTWLRDGAAGVLRLTLNRNRIVRMDVTFDRAS